MRFASAYYLGLIGLLSLVARAIPMNQQPQSLVSRASRSYIYKDVEFLEGPPPNMRNPLSTGVDQTLSVVDSVSKDAKDILRSFLSRHDNGDIVSDVKFKNDYPFNRLGNVIYYSATKRFLTHHTNADVYDIYGWVLSGKDGQGKFHGSERSQSQPMSSPSELCNTCRGPHTGLPNI
ncbi:hypothetical protein GGU11DRAFT_75942 [Lentinula aff. detonsa]|nr:hypothetical protein GGU11DRAFT_75942 [Lentinula aff. detonsa]